MIYFDWLMQNEHRRTRLGDLSQYAAADADFPRSPGNLADLIDYLRGSHAPEHIVHAATASWPTWRQVEPEGRAAEALAEALAEVQQNSGDDLTAFYEWMLTQQHGTSLVSAFARDVVADPRFPHTVARPRELVAYLKAKGATDDAIRTSQLAWITWRRGLQKNKGAGMMKEVSKPKHLTQRA